MRKVILNLAVTLDGYIEGPNGEVDWCRIDETKEDSGAGSHFDQFLARIDAIFYGRISYDLWGTYQPGEDASQTEKNLWSGVHSKKKYVFSKRHKPESDGPIFITRDIASRVREIKSQSGKDIWLYGGGKLITTFMNEGLVDNLLLAVYPVILGGGKPLFENIKERIGLKLNSVTTSPSGVIMLDYVTR
jgi:dihydrofolate reductase